MGINLFKNKNNKNKRVRAKPGKEEKRAYPHIHML